MKRVSRILWVTLGGVIAVQIFALGHYVLDQITGPVPYENTRIEAAQLLGDDLFVRVYTEKLGCDITRYNTIGLLGPVRNLLDFDDLDHGRELVDRKIGPQIVRHMIHLDGVKYDSIEGWTTHTCGDVTVDRVLYKIKLPLPEEQT